MPRFTFAYLRSGIEWHRGVFDSSLTAQRFGEELFKLEPRRPTDEIRVWDGYDTDREPNATVTREV